MANEVKVLCPVCGAAALREQVDGKTYVTCETCDVRYDMRPDGPATVAQLGPFEDHERRLQALEERSPKAERPPAGTDPQPAGQDEPATEPSSRADRNGFSITVDDSED